MMTPDPDEDIATPPDASNEALSALLRLDEYQANVRKFGPCAHPLHRVARSAPGAEDWVVLRCRNRRAVACPSCSALYRLDARHLLSAGLAGGKDTPAPVASRPHAGPLWAAFTTATRRTLANTAGISRTEAGRQVRVVFAKVAEFQTRGVVHLHAVVRLDAVEASTLPAWATTTALRRSVRRAARTARVITPGSPLMRERRLRWGRQCDVRPITAGSGQASVAVVAQYIAKYATKAAENAGLDLGPIWCRTCDATGATTLGPGLVRLCRDCHGTGRRADIDLDRLTEHARLVQTCWRLGAQGEYTHLRLRRHAHQAGYRGHFLTKSHTWSTTFAALRAERYAFVQAQRGNGHPPGTGASGRSIHDHHA